MKKKFNTLIKSSFFRNVTIMATGAVGAQAVTVALSPIITRLYGPEAFGVLGAFNAIIMMIMPIVALTYPIAIVLPKSDENAKKIVKLSLYITFMIALITTAIIILFNKNIVEIFQLQKIASYLYLIPLVIIFTGIMQVSQQWLIRTNQFSISAKVNFLQSIFTNGSKVGIGLIYPTAVTLVILQSLSNGIRALMLIMFAKKSDYKQNENLSKERIYSVRELSRKYKDFPIYRAPQVFLGSFSESLPILLLTTFFGPASAGFYTIGRTVLGLPSTLIGNAVGEVFYPRITEAANNGENIKRLIKKATISLVAVGIIPFGTVIIFGPFLFEFVFGAGWDMAGEYARWIALLSFAVFANQPIVKAMPVLNAQRFLLIYTIIQTLTRVVVLYIGFSIFNSDIIAIALFGISSLLLQVFLFIIGLRKSEKIQTI